MTTATLEQVQRLVDQLSPLEQARLLEYLTPRIVRVVANVQAGPAVGGTALADAWQTFFQIGDELAASDQPGMPTLTETIQAIRR
jgi:hypothetical protein